ARLWREDVAGSIAWCRALARARVLSPEEAASIEAGLSAIEAEIASDPTLLARSDAEDVHTFVEGRLADRVGPLAKKLHTGRSRNDQVATDLKLHVRARAGAIEERITDVVTALVELA